MAEPQRLQHWLLQTAQMMANHLEDVHVELLGVDDRIALRLHVHPSDVGKMIGRQGRIAPALRIIGAAIAAAMGKRFSLDIADDDKDWAQRSNARHNRNTARPISPPLLQGSAPATVQRFVP